MQTKEKMPTMQILCLQNFAWKQGDRQSIFDVRMEI